GKIQWTGQRRGASVDPGRYPSAVVGISGLSFGRACEPYCCQKQAIQTEPIALDQRGGHRRPHDRNSHRHQYQRWHQMTDHLVEEPQTQPWRGDDHQLTGGEPGQDLVLTLHVGGHTYTRHLRPPTTTVRRRRE